MKALVNLINRLLKGEFDYHLVRVSMVIIIPFMPDGWAASAGGFPAMIGNVAFLMKDVVLLAASVYLLKQDAVRVPLTADHANLAFQQHIFHSAVR